MSRQIARYQGRAYRVGYIGPTKFGRRAKLIDGTREFWVDAAAVTISDGYGKILQQATMTGSESREVRRTSPDQSFHRHVTGRRAGRGENPDYVVHDGGWVEY